MGLGSPLIAIAFQLVYPGQQPVSQILPLCRKSGGGPQVFDFEIRLCWIGFDHKRRVLGPVESGPTASHGMRQVDVCRQSPALAKRSRDN